ncbi:uncharacterized protein L3040_003192 [Drepanopeziza brunnea f. sp. 'multigermtubi']|uniref:Large ribosomal subunit protein mL50 n=1 Tax=Marssonina brunnea f. sp. multigermtubi (strain MB_m1) TaxID=1072389 RepID=K1WEQ3_MARBU|nr:uncharacterized protein MBM_05961 [Drepanopeziza brunnea f. sp. 'multigermtubi' MB_m1]EKD15950.1 hypothetical protein MBM_05961 [Drepanopeziza brunnea f. sp. 'multigermtubi' MB_m1]KAJ5047365.1 hypothetical protein L3040_003192 [Drepanopeziza brunnea f. sp. 'multigermtubi']
MRRISRSHRSIDLLRTRATANLSPSSTYLCAACRNHAAPFSTSMSRTARDKIPMSEKLRRRIWGTDSPPGLKDPYGDQSVFDQTKQREREQEIEDAKEERATQLAAIEAQRRQRETVADLDTSGYEPATTWDGLEEVGGPLRDPRDWEGEYTSIAFAPREVMVDSEEITAALHRAMVEVFALQEAGVPLSSISTEQPGQDLTMDVTFGEDAKLQFAENAPSLEDIVQSLAPVVDETIEKMDPTESEEDVAADRSDVDPLHPDAEEYVVEETAEEAEPTESEEDVAADRSTEDPLQAQADSVEITFEDLIASWGPAWLQVSIENPEVKFAVHKRMMQITGLRIPDAHLKAQTPHQLLKHLVKAPKPRKLVEALSQKEDLVTLPNVAIYGKRITPIDKQRSLGRWKIIEKELEARGLPVTGH